MKENQTKQKRLVELCRFCYTCNLPTKILGDKLAGDAMFLRENREGGYPNFPYLFFGKTFLQANFLHFADQISKSLNATIGKIVNFFLSHIIATSTFTLLILLRGLSFLHLVKARLAAKAKLLASTRSTLSTGYGLSQKTRVKYVFIFQRTLHLFRYKYSTLTNFCQKCAVKSRKLALIYQHKINTTLSYRVHAPLYCNTPLTEYGVMLPQK